VQVQDAVQQPLDEMFGDVPGAMAAIQANADAGFHLQVRPRDGGGGGDACSTCM
jgi:hypothetical protein